MSDANADAIFDNAVRRLDRAAQYEAARARDRPVSVEMLSASPLAKLIDAEAATWLDVELLADDPKPLRDAGFGREVRDAQARRRQWLISEELAEERGGLTHYRADMIQTLRRRELIRIGARLSSELGIPFAEAENGGRVAGIYRRHIDALSGRYALIEKSREFTLVPWRPVLERRLGKAVSGNLKGGGISWDIGRVRGGPSIS